MKIVAFEFRFLFSTQIKYAKHGLQIPLGNWQLEINKL